MCKTQNMARLWSLLVCLALVGCARDAVPEAADDDSTDSGPDLERNADVDDVRTAGDNGADPDPHDSDGEQVSDLGAEVEPQDVEDAADTPDDSSPDAPDREIADADAAPDADVAPPCEPNTCPFGTVCDGQRCVEAECHRGDLDNQIPDKPCPDGALCVVPLDGEHPPTYGSCEPFARECAYNQECPFGFLCIERTCVHADCHFGTDLDSPGFGPRPCEEPNEICSCMEDGVDLNGGRGRCRGVDEDC